MLFADSADYIPYSGVLRGAQGVLIERRGNSLDRALLLAELIAATGSDVRVARGSAMVIESRPVVRPKADDTALGVALLPSAQRAAAQAGLARRADCDAAVRTTNFGYCATRTSWITRLPVESTRR